MASRVINGTNWFLSFLWSFSMLFCITALKMDFVLNSLQGEIFSPNYPSNYPLNISFTWTINKNLGKYLRLSFVDFQVEKAKRCIYDSLQIRDSKSLPWRDVPKHCGEKLPEDVITQNSMLQIRFTSDSYNIVDRGFRISWQSEDDAGNKVIEQCKQAIKLSKEITACPPVTAVKLLRRMCKDQYCDCKSKSGNGAGNYKKPGLQNSQKINHDVSLQAGTRDKKKPFVCPGSQETLCKEHMARESDESSNEKNVAVGIFGALLVIFVVINIVLMFFLWKRNKELDNLKSTTTHFSTSPGIDWIPCGKPAIHITNSHDSTKTATLTPKSSIPTRTWGVDGTKQLNSIRQYKRREGSPRNYVKRSTIEQQRYFSLLSGIVRTPRTGRRHSGNMNDEESYEETSDIYVSSSYPSPTPSHCNDRFAV